MKRYRIQFKYADSLSNGEWRTQECSLCADSSDSAIEKCKKLYGLGVDCEYEIVSVKEEQ